MGGGPCHWLKGVEEIVFIENVEGRAYIIIICCEISRVEFAHLYTFRLVEICLNILLLLIKYFITFSKILSLNICTKLEIKKDRAVEVPSVKSVHCLYKNVQAVNTSKKNKNPSQSCGVRSIFSMLLYRSGSSLPKNLRSDKRDVRITFFTGNTEI